MAMIGNRRIGQADLAGGGGAVWLDPWHAQRRILFEPYDEPNMLTIQPLEQVRNSKPAVHNDGEPFTLLVAELVEEHAETFEQWL